jgi:hypothetical protein
VHALPAQFTALQLPTPPEQIQPRGASRRREPARRQKVLIAIVLRHEETLIRILEQLTAVVAQNARIVDRPGVIEDRLNALEDSGR